VTGALRHRSSSGVGGALLPSGIPGWKDSAAGVSGISSPFGFSGVSSPPNSGVGVSNSLSIFTSLVLISLAFYRAFCAQTTF